MKDLKKARYEIMEKEISKLTEKQFENFLKHFDENTKDCFKRMRFWAQMKYNKDFYKKVEQTLAKASYKHFNS